MKFTPLGNKYRFSEKALTKTFPDYMKKPLEDWLYSLLNRNNLVVTSDWMEGSHKYLESNFHNQLQIQFRESFSQNWIPFIESIFKDDERVANFLALCLQNYCKGIDAYNLEIILSQGGSGYEVKKTDQNASQYSEGVYTLIERVSSVIKAQSADALDSNELLETSWELCYSRTPDYEKTVSGCCDFLEVYLRDVYFPKDTKPQLKKFIHFLRENPAIMSYKGDSLVTPKSAVTDLLEKASDIRGQHTAGNGRNPTKQEAEFVLHSTIFIWNIHQK